MFVAAGSQCSHSRGLPLETGGSCINELLHHSPSLCRGLIVSKIGLLSKISCEACRFCAGRIFIDCAFRYRHGGCRERDKFQLAQARLLRGRKAANCLLRALGLRKNLGDRTARTRSADRSAAPTSLAARIAQPAADSSCRSGNRSLAPRLWPSSSISIQRRSFAMHAWDTFQLIRCT